MFQESKKQLIGLAFTILSVVAISVTARFMDDPDALALLKMRTAQKVKSASNRVALAALNVADRADLVYEGERK